jgi:drug/metabolite transporter (DMT)-like permease
MVAIMWIPLSFLYAFFDSLQNAYYKKAAVQINPILMAWSVLVISALCYTPLLFLGIPHLNTTFWIAVLVRLILDSVAFTLFITGVQKSPLSLTIPMMSLSPVLSVGTVFIINHLLPSPLGFIGVLVTMGGLYYLNFDHDTKHLLSPFKAVMKERGVLYVAIAAILWSIVSAFQKLAIDNSSVYFYTAFFQLLWAICFTPVAYFTDKKHFASMFRAKSVKLLLPGGILDAIKNFAQNAALSFAIPAYVNSIGNTGILFSSLFAAVFFKEKIEKHIVPILIIFTGVTLVVLGQR